MCQVLGQLGVLEMISAQMECESLFNRAVDVRSASMLYLAVHIQHDATLMGGIGTYARDSLY